MKIVEAQMSQRDAVLIALSDLVPEELAPDLLISSETNERLHDLGHRLSQQNLDLEKFLQITNQSPDDLLATLRADAVRAVRIDLALRALVKAEKIEPTEAEIEEELVSTAEAMSTKPEILRQNLRDSGRVVTFQAEVAKMKASRWLNDNVTFVDPDGVEIDRELLKVDQSQDLDA
jgi:trigger factor